MVKEHRAVYSINKERGTIGIGRGAKEVVQRT